MSHRTVRIVLSGSVQGCGLRPTLARLAARQAWSGSVKNTTAGVELAIEGELPGNEELAAMIHEALPVRDSISRITFMSGPRIEVSGFCIETSQSDGLLVAPIPRDVSICGDCLREANDPTNRRFRYPLISCAVCGPRYSVLQSMPFDRERTTLAGFSMCQQCRLEYENPDDRRFHAQTICCPRCGPQVWACTLEGNRIATKDDAVCQAAEVLLQGGIVALRAVGGYQLLVDATSPFAVNQLRQRKQRPAKPFALICRSLVEANEIAFFRSSEQQQLQSTQNPIVVLRQRKLTAIAEEVNPGLNEIGLFLPSTALHDRLLEIVDRPLVCTSGNRDGEPLAFKINDAHERLKGIADLFLHHDREIEHPIDDSVVRVIADRAVTIRCGRGMAPLPLDLSVHSSCLALGGQQKSAFAYSNGHQAVLDRHLGDLDTVANQEAWSLRIRRGFELFDGAQPVLADDLTASMDGGRAQRFQSDSIAYDPHPHYYPTQRSADFESVKRPVWHHHAHIVAGMLQHQWLVQTVLGVAFDGTGLGPDGTVWGGELLIASATKFQRIGHLRPFGLFGGEAAISDLRRLAVSLLSQLDELDTGKIAQLSRLTESEVRRLLRTAKTAWSIQTTSCGRLFDASACLILDLDSSSYEGHAAMLLESACDQSEAGEYTFEIQETHPFEIDWRPVFRKIIKDRSQNISVGSMAMRFHRGLAQAILAVSRRFPHLPVVVGGGVFQNRVLGELLADAWPAKGPPIGLPGVIPPNDGGLAAGQLAVAMMLANEKDQL